MSEHTEHSVLGKRIPGIDSHEKVSGVAKFTADMVLPNMLYGKILRSPHAHAEIVGIDVSKAKALPGVKCVLTGKDTLGKKQGIWRRFPRTLQ